MSSGPLIRRNSHISFMIRRRACNASTPGEVNIDGATIYANVIQIFILFVYFFFMETLPRWILSDLWWWWWGGGGGRRNTSDCGRAPVHDPLIE